MCPIISLFCALSTNLRRSPCTHARRGHQVCFYKRAQIFVADVWGAFGGQGAGAFSDVGALTMFADYRVPAQLRTMDLLEYSPGLASRVRTCEGGRGEVVGSSWGGPLANSPML